MRVQAQQLRQYANVTALGISGRTPGERVTLVVRFAVLPELLRFFELERALEKLLGVRIDLVLADLFKSTADPAEVAQIEWLWS